MRAMTASVDMEVGINEKSGVGNGGGAAVFFFNLITIIQSKHNINSLSCITNIIIN